MSSSTSSSAPTADAFAGRLFEAALGAVDLLTVYLGDRLGYYRALAESGPLTPAGLATRTGTDERYAREWLEQQGATGILTVTDDGPPRRFHLPAPYRDVLVDEHNLVYMAPIARFLVSVGGLGGTLTDAFKTGAGIDWSEYGPDAIEAQAAFNRPLFENLLAQEYLANIPDIHERLSQPGARVADVGCGGGWSTIAMAKAYPTARVHGYDIDRGSIDLARANLRDSGVEDRVAFHCVDAAIAPGAGSYDLVTAFECIHDMPDPVAVLHAMRLLANSEGSWLVMDERVADAYEAPASEVDRLMYGFSVLCCLPAGRVQPRSAATGTVMRSGTFREYALAAGFSGVDVLPLDHAMFRFYRLRR